MSGDDLTPEALKRQYADVIPKSSTFESKGVSAQDARAFLDTDEGAMYWYRLAEAAEPGTHSSAIDDRAMNQVRSGLDLPRMEALDTHEPLVKIVPAGASPSSYSPFWTTEAELDAAVKAGKNLSQHFGLPIVSESPRYDVYRITPKVPTQVFVSTVAPTTELGGLVNKTGGAEQSLAPNRQLFTDPVHVRSVDNRLHLVASVERGGMSPNLARGVTALGAAATIYDAATTANRTAELLQQDNPLGAQSQMEHFAGRNLGGWGGAAAGAGAGGAIANVPGAVLGGVLGGGIGALGGEKLADVRDDQKIYTQSDAHGQEWHYNPNQPQHGWTRTALMDYPDAAQRAQAGQPMRHWQTFTADAALADRLNYQASNASVELALGSPATPRDPYTQPAGPHDTPSQIDAPWTRDAQTKQWSRTVTDQVMERNQKNTDIKVVARAVHTEGML